MPVSREACARRAGRLAALPVGCGSGRHEVCGGGGRVCGWQMANDTNSARPECNDNGFVQNYGQMCVGFDILWLMELCDRTRASTVEIETGRCDECDDDDGDRLQRPRAVTDLPSRLCRVRVRAVVDRVI